MPVGLSVPILEDSHLTPTEPSLRFLLSLQDAQKDFVLSLRMVFISKKS